MPCVTVKTSARIHINSIDMNGAIGRIIGGIGFAIREPKIEIVAKVENNNEVLITGHNVPKTDWDEYKNEIETVVEKFKLTFNIRQGINIIVRSAYPKHIGLGSSTQTRLAVGIALARLLNITISFNEIAKIVSDKWVSGVGYGAFRHGGFIVDGGFTFGRDKDIEYLGGSSKRPPPIIFHGRLPKTWQIILFIPKEDRKSIHGESENIFFKKITPTPLEEARIISHYTLIKLLPSLLEENYDDFLDVMLNITKIGSKKFEIKLNKWFLEKVKEKLNKIRIKLPFLAVSSVGPTLYTVINTNKQSHKLILNKLRKNKLNSTNIIITSARNKPAKIIDSGCFY